MKISRRNALSTLALGSAGIAIPHRLQARDTPSPSQFRYCLNTSTISGNNPGLLKYVEIASRAGYDGMEIWVRDLKAALKEGPCIRN